jgi:hypothetical protein
MRDALAATAWAVALVAATPPLVAGLDGGSVLAGAPGAPPRGVIVGAALGAVFAIASCAVRGRAGERVDGRVG